MNIRKAGLFGLGVWAVLLLAPASDGCGDSPIGCPATVVYSSGAYVWYGEYLTAAQAYAAIDEAEQAALDRAENAAKATCPQNCDNPQTAGCFGVADFDDQGAAGEVYFYQGAWRVRVHLSINKQYSCNCE